MSHFNGIIVSESKTFCPKKHDNLEGIIIKGIRAEADFFSFFNYLSGRTMNFSILI